MLPRRTRIVLAVLVVASLTFVILDLRGGDGPFSSARAAASAVFGGVQRAATTVFSPVIGASDWWSRQRDQAAQIGELRAENDNLKLLVEMGANDRARAEALDELLRVAGVGRYRIIPAEVIAVGPAQGFAWTITIDTGTNDGIEQDMTVINGQGLVGRVVKTTTNSSTVVLLVDASAAVGGRVAGSDEIGIVSGTGRQDSLDFQLLDPLAQLRAGDAIVTFGSRGGRPYAPGLPIGEIVDVSGSAGQLTRVATVRPFANVSALSVVAVVVRPPREDPRDSVLPRATNTAPSPSPTSEAGPSDEVEQAATPEPTPEPTVQRERPATPVPAGE
jgi:rod shape-determining protein MreC